MFTPRRNGSQTCYIRSTVRDLLTENDVAKKKVCRKNENVPEEITLEEYIASQDAYWEMIRSLRTKRNDRSNKPRRLYM